jgi:hypothetical protein
MREEKVKVSFIQGENAVRAHGPPLAIKPGSRKKTSGEPAIT